MKLEKELLHGTDSKVAPFAGARIEIGKSWTNAQMLWVAPFAGARIEIVRVTPAGPCKQSLPSRERGLKFKDYMLEVGGRTSLPSRERGLK